MQKLLKSVQRTLLCRQTTYDHPKRNMKHIANVCSALLKKKVTAKDIATIMIVVKLCREQFRHKEDNIRDAIGYLVILNEVGEDEK